MPYTKKRYGSKKKYLKYKRCVKKVKKKGKVKSPYAICRSSIYGKKMARRRRKKSRKR